VLARALQAGTGDASMPFAMAARPVPVAGELAGCRETPPADSIPLSQVLEYGCPFPVQALGSRLGLAAFEQLYSDFRLTEALSLGLPTLVDDTPLAPGSDAGQSALGQGGLTVTPLHLALVTAAIARGGVLPAPRIVLAVQSSDGTWEPAPATGSPVAALAPEAARAVAGMIDSGYAALAYAEPNRRQLAWYLAFSSEPEPAYALAVLVEDGSLTAAESIGRAILTAATP
jgi:peptidoglycan glycosyltransferase